MNIKSISIFKEKKSIYLISVFALSMMCCKPLSKISNSNIQNEFLTENDYEKLNGIYSNNYDTIIGRIQRSPYDGIIDYQRITILYQLLGNSYPETAWGDENNQRINPKEKWIKIEFQSSKYLTISMYHNEKFKFSKRIRGKFKNGFFYLRPKVYVIPFVPIIFGYNFEQARLGKSIDDDLLIDYTLNRLGYALFGGSEENGVATTIYKEKEK